MCRGMLIIGVTCYVTLLIYLTLVFSPQFHPTPNLVLFRTITECWSIGGRTMLLNIVGNLVLLAPIGMLVAARWPGRTGMVGGILAGLLVSISIEATQFLCGHRMADVDDLLLNTIGAGMGAMAVCLVQHGMEVAHRQDAVETTTGRRPVVVDEGSEERRPHVLTLTARHDHARRVST